MSNFWDEKKDVIIFGGGPVGLWTAILLIKFERARKVYLLEKRIEKDMWNIRNYIVKINNGYLLQIKELFNELNKNKGTETVKKDDYSIKKTSFEKILKNYNNDGEENKYEKEYNEKNPNPSKMEYDQDFYAISNFQIFLREYFEKKYGDRINVLSVSENDVNYDKNNNNLKIISKNIKKGVEIGKIIDCTGIISYIMNKTLGIKYEEEKATNYGVGIKINWNKSTIMEIYKKQAELLEKEKDEKKYIQYKINKGNISNIEFEDVHIPNKILNAKVLFAECIREQDNLLVESNYNINKNVRKSYLPFKKTVLEGEYVGELLINREKYKDNIGQLQRDALRLFWKECVDIYNKDEDKETKKNILDFFQTMKKSGMFGINAYETILHLRKIKTNGALAIICYILNHLFYCRFIPQIEKGEDITKTKNIYIIDENGKNIKNVLLNENYINDSKSNKIEKLFIDALKEIQITFVPERVEHILKKNLVNIEKVEINSNLSENVKVFAIGDSLFSTDFSMGMGVNRGLSTALQIIRDGISPQRIRNEINKYVHPKKLPKNTDWKLLYNLNSNYYFYVETILPHNMIQNGVKKKRIYKERKERLIIRRKYMKYIIKKINELQN